MITLVKALELYMVIKPHLPVDVDEEDTALSFLHRVIDSMEAEPLAYVDSISIMSGLPLETLLEFTSKEVVELFMTGMVENNVFELVSFCRSMGI